MCHLLRNIFQNKHKTCHDVTALCHSTVDTLNKQQEFCLCSIISLNEDQQYPLFTWFRQPSRFEQNVKTEKKKKYFKRKKKCTNNMEDIHEKLQECLKTVSQEPFGK